MTDDSTGVTILPEGAYWDGEDMLHAKDGTLLPDGLYKDANGNVIIYEGNFNKMWQ